MTTNESSHSRIIWKPGHTNICILAIADDGRRSQTIAENCFSDRVLVGDHMETKLFPEGGVEGRENE